MQRPKPTKPPGELTDKQILARMNKLIDWFYDLAKGDPFGWDWPTMNVLEPELCGEYRALRAEAVSRLDKRQTDAPADCGPRGALQVAGPTSTFNGVPYFKLDGKWCPTPK